MATIASPGTKQENQERLAPLYNVVLLDDAEHTYDYVVEMLQNRRLTFEQTAWRLEPYNLSVVTTRRAEADTYELLSSPRLAELIRDAREQYDYVLLDCPPLLPIPDSRLLTESIDGFVIVVGADKTPRKLLEETLALLGPSKILGLVFNGESYRHSSYSKYYYSYHKRA